MSSSHSPTAQAATAKRRRPSTARVNKTSGRVLVNDISSIYGKPGQQYQGWVNDGLLRYASDRFSKNDKPQPGTTVEASIASRGSPDQGLTERKLLTESDVVKYHQASAATEQDGSEDADADRDRILEEGSRRGQQVVQGATGERSQVANPQDPAADGIPVLPMQPRYGAVFSCLASRENLHVQLLPCGAGTHG